MIKSPKLKVESNHVYIFFMLFKNCFAICFLVFRRWNQFVDCVHMYMDKCFTEARKKEFNKAVEVPIDSVHQMCSDIPYQTGKKWIVKL